MDDERECKMSDLISRQAVLEKFNAMCELCGKREKYNGVMCRACALDDGICIVEEIPSAEPERTAKVENIEDPAGLGAYGDCSECGAEVTEQYAYCPNCGARLEWK